MHVCVLPHWSEGLRLVNDFTVSILTMTFESILIPLEVTDRNQKIINFLSHLLFHMGLSSILPMTSDKEQPSQEVISNASVKGGHSYLTHTGLLL